ncbi:aldehyde dehydrogenase family 3 member B2 isoform X5 [Vicugna pacos]|uniref:Aldehyde dehydrogenase family 3 member B2 isoform X5 n=1 Tax=Vicugna pacos TaxID=30538 RepID=A0ABM5E061_VICPA
MGVNVGVRRRPDQMELQLVRPRCRSTARCVHRRRPAAAQAPGRIGGRQGWGETWAWSSRHIWRQNVRQRQQRFGKGSRIGADTGSAFEGDVSEIIICQNEVDLALKNLHAWMKDESVAKNLFTQLDSAFIRKEPFGLVLIVAPWNYPVNLTLVPLVGALAAGNCVVLKPSEISKGTEKVLAEVLPRYLDQSCFAVVLGGPEETGQLLKHKFDYILFTGSPRVGKIIMAAATKHLTPVTLELGGKNPCYVDDDCDPQTVANRVAWFRYFNTGQTCVAPDYVLCSPEMQARLLPALQSAITRFYGEDPQSSPDLGRIINHKHFQRLRDLLSCGRVAIGGQSDESECYIAPTVLVDVQETEPVMQEEIFGPILPIMNVRGLDEAIDFINRREKPLALYAFSNSNQATVGWEDTTASSPSTPSPTTVPACSPARAWRSSTQSATLPILNGNSS